MKDFFCINDTVRPAEACTWNGETVGRIADIWIDGITEYAEVVWASGNIGTWPTSELRSA